MRCILREAGLVSRNLKKPTKTAWGWAGVVALLLTGRSLDKWHVVNKLPSASEQAKWIEKGDSVCVLEHSTVLHALRLEQKDDGEVVYRHDVSVELPLPTLLKRLFTILFAQTTVASTIKIDGVCRWIRKKFGRPISPSRVAITLSGTLRYRTRDPIEIGWIANDIVLLHRDKGAHYYRVSEDRLRDLYTSAIEGLYTDAGISETGIITTASYRYVDRECGFGIRSDWQPWIYKLKHQFRNSNGDIFRHHNRLAHHVVEMCLVATGHRVVRGMFDALVHFSEDFRWLQASDKANSEQQRWRWISVPPMAQEQLTVYLDHLKHLSKCQTLNITTRHQISHAINREGRIFEPFLFWFDEGKIERFNPGNLSRMRRGTEIGPYSHRVQLRSNLRSDGCHPQGIGVATWS